MQAPTTPEDSLAQRMMPAFTGYLPDFGDVQWLTETGSTNADLIQRVQHAGRPALPWLLGADRQTSARGRAGRPWENSYGATLMFSCAFEVNLPLDKLASLSPALGIVAAEALRALLVREQVAHTDLQVKWPNDLFWKQAKLAGILVESAKLPDSNIPVIVAGIGLNLHHAISLTETLKRPIADWSQITDIAPEQIVIHIANAWTQAIQEYARTGYASFIARFDQVNALAGQQVEVTDQGKILNTGVALGCDEIGRLLIETGQGSIAVMVGDVSIRSATTNNVVTTETTSAAKRLP